MHSNPCQVNGVSASGLPHYKSVFCQTPSVMQKKINYIVLYLSKKPQTNQSVELLLRGTGQYPADAEQPLPENTPYTLSTENTKKV